ncbi:hypothetical protein [Aureimonas sp. AU4]|uniref:hypothetical protein n=1 Tax=Aureimonas sp. AU4 TaxID=1638163 RepID=UPI0012E36DE0|nr:hypothetical protein [Aureimonas sp. AU4]
MSPHDWEEDVAELTASVSGMMNSCDAHQTLLTLRGSDLVMWWGNNALLLGPRSADATKLFAPSRAFGLRWQRSPSVFGRALAGFSRSALVWQLDR